MAASDFEYPDDLQYTAEHEWIRLGGEVARVGITAFAQDAMGDIVYVTLPAVDDGVTAGQPCGEVESTKSVSDLFAPLTGTVTAVNDRLDATPELVNSDPYGEGWMFEVRTEPGAEATGLLDVEEYRGSLG